MTLARSVRVMSYSVQRRKEDSRSPNLTHPVGGVGHVPSCMFFCKVRMRIAPSGGGCDDQSY